MQIANLESKTKSLEKVNLSMREELDKSHQRGEDSHNQLESIFNQKIMEYERKLKHSESLQANSGNDSLGREGERLRAENGQLKSVIDQKDHEIQKLIMVIHEQEQGLKMNEVKDKELQKVREDCSVAKS